tara:strand:- start:16474 stop:16653 length:180 start_codon:yes stop_codon:yes gene_type:complete
MNLDQGFKLARIFGSYLTDVQTISQPPWVHQKVLFHVDLRWVRWLYCLKYLWGLPQNRD